MMISDLPMLTVTDGQWKPIRAIRINGEHITVIPVHGSALINSQPIITGQSQADLAIRVLEHEKREEFNAGLDAVMLNNKLNLELNYYYIAEIRCYHYRGEYHSYLFGSQCTPCSKL